MDIIATRSGYVFKHRDMKRMTEAEKAHIVSGRWKVESVDTTNAAMVENVLKGHCKYADGKVVVKPETEWPENKVENDIVLARISK